MAEEIKMEPVESSNVSNVGYDKDSKTLAVQFKNGGIYHYADVPEELHKELLAAESIGKFIGANVVKKFEFTKI